MMTVKMADISGDSKFSTKKEGLINNFCNSITIYT